MELGWLDVCLRVQCVTVSRAFYETLGFRRVEGDDGEGWAVVVHGESRIGLFEPKLVGTDAITLNFRGGDVRAMVERLREAGYEPDKPARFSEAGASAHFRDPDGHAIFLDAARDEVKLTAPI